MSTESDQKCREILLQQDFEDHQGDLGEICPAGPESSVYEIVPGIYRYVYQTCDEPDEFLVRVTDEQAATLVGRCCLRYLADGTPAVIVQRAVLLPY